MCACVCVVVVVGGGGVVLPPPKKMHRTKHNPVFNASEVRVPVRIRVRVELSANQTLNEYENEKLTLSGVSICTPRSRSAMTVPVSPS